MTETQRYAKVPAEMSRAGWARNSGHVATCGSMRGTGPTMSAALESLGSQLEAIAKAAHTMPSFWHDAQNDLLTVAVPFPDGTGWMSYTVRLGQESGPVLASGTTIAGGPVSEAYAGAIGYERVPPERYGAHAS